MCVKMWNVQSKSPPREQKADDDSNHVGGGGGDEEVMMLGGKSSSCARLSLTLLERYTGDDCTLMHQRLF